MTAGTCPVLLTARAASSVPFIHQESSRHVSKANVSSVFFWFVRVLSSKTRGVAMFDE